MHKRIDELLAAHGPLARHMPGYTPRPAQVIMANAIDDAIQNGRHLLAEVPPGTGRMLAMAVVASVHAARIKRVVFATADPVRRRELTEQILPALAAALPDEFCYASLMAHRFQNFARDSSAPGALVLVCHPSILCHHLRVKGATGEDRVLPSLRWQGEAELRQRLGPRFHGLFEATAELARDTVRASSVIENLNSRLRSYFFLRREIGPEYLDLLRFFLNHRRFLRSERSERVGRSPTEILTGEPHPHWLSLLGFERFRRN